MTGASAETFCRQTKNSAASPKIYERPTGVPAAGQLFQKAKRHCRRDMVAGPKCRGSWNHNVGASFVPG